MKRILILLFGSSVSKSKFHISEFKEMANVLKQNKMPPNFSYFSCKLFLRKSSRISGRYRKPIPYVWGARMQNMSNFSCYLPKAPHNASISVSTQISHPGDYQYLVTCGSHCSYLPPAKPEIEKQCNTESTFRQTQQQNICNYLVHCCCSRPAKKSTKDPAQSFLLEHLALV